MKPLFLLVISLWSSIFQQMEAMPEQINWRSHFLAQPDKHSPYFAMTATRWHYSYTANVRGQRLHIDFKFMAGIDPNESWVKLNELRGAESKRKLLNHEQGHVNINFLLLKDGEQQIRFQNYTVNNYKSKILTNAKKVSQYYSELQKRYDEETQHGSNDTAQARWDRYIEQELRKFTL